jgi:hypothetical protein
MNIKVKIVQDEAGHPEFVMLPWEVFERFREEIEEELEGMELAASEVKEQLECREFNPSDYLTH